MGHPRSHCDAAVFLFKRAASVFSSRGEGVAQPVKQHITPPQSKRRVLLLSSEMICTCLRCYERYCKRLPSFGPPWRRPQGQAECFLHRGVQRAHAEGCVRQAVRPGHGGPAAERGTGPRVPPPPSLRSGVPLHPLFLCSILRQPPSPHFPTQMTRYPLFSVSLLSSFSCAVGPPPHSFRLVPPNPAA